MSHSFLQSYKDILTQWGDLRALGIRAKLPSQIRLISAAWSRTVQSICYLRAVKVQLRVEYLCTPLPLPASAMFREVCNSSIRPCGSAQKPGEFSEKAEFCLLEAFHEFGAYWFVPRLLARREAARSLPDALSTACSIALALRSWVTTEIITSAAGFMVRVYIKYCQLDLQVQVLSAGSPCGNSWDPLAIAVFGPIIIHWSFLVVVRSRNPSLPVLLFLALASYVCSRKCFGKVMLFLACRAWCRENSLFWFWRA